MTIDELRAFVQDEVSPEFRDPKRALLAALDVVRAELAEWTDRVSTMVAERHGAAEVISDYRIKLHETRAALRELVEARDEYDACRADPDAPGVRRLFTAWRNMHNAAKRLLEKSK